jgi:flagellar P-ring protein precursor FlgI
LPRFLVNNKRFMKLIVIVVMQMFMHLPVAANGTVRVKDVTTIAGVNGIQLIGYGLIVGLGGTGDGNKSAFTVNSIVSMLEKLGITVSSDEIKVKNVAAVVVTAELPPFTVPGSRIDVTVSSLGDANSLEGGQLMLTPLRAYDGVTYAVAQGAVSIGGFNIDAGAGNILRRNHSSVGRVPEGAITRKQPENQVVANDKFILTLNDADYQSVTNITEQINKVFRMKLASALNSRSVEVVVPPEYRTNPVAFIANVGRMEVVLDNTARVVINERTGTVVIGGEVMIAEVAIAHGNLQVEIKASYGVSQPMAFGDGESVIVPQIETRVEDM